MGKIKIIARFILRFGLLILGIILTIAYYFDLGVSINVSSFWSVFILTGLFVAFRYHKIKYGLKNSTGSANGIGTTLYGKKDIESDGSYIATKWFIFFLLPIFPVGSYRVLPNTPKMISVLRQETTFRRFEEVPLNKKQVVNTYLLIYGFIFLVFVLPIIIFN